MSRAVSTRARMGGATRGIAHAWGGPHVASHSCMGGVTRGIALMHGGCHTWHHTHAWGVPHVASHSCMGGPHVMSRAVRGVPHVESHCDDCRAGSGPEPHTQRWATRGAGGQHMAQGGQHVAQGGSTWHRGAAQGTGGKTWHRGAARGTGGQHMACTREQSSGLHIQGMARGSNQGGPRGPRGAALQQPGLRGYQGTNNNVNNNVNQ